MKLAFCAILLCAAMLCSAQQSDLVPSRRRYLVTEAKTISVQELEHRTQSKARGAFMEAKIAAQHGDHKRAVKLFEKVLNIDPVFSDARNDLAVELIVVGDADGAVAQLQQLIQLDPHFVMGYTNLGVVLCNQKKFSAAEALMRRALSVDPNSAKANLLLGVALYAQGNRGAETRNALEAAARSNPIAVKLLKDWFAISDVADTAAPN
jgi:Flp pilus assembly protein TadD